MIQVRREKIIYSVVFLCLRLYGLTLVILSFMNFIDSWLLTHIGNVYFTTFVRIMVNGIASDTLDCSFRYYYVAYGHLSRYRKKRFD